MKELVLILVVLISTAALGRFGYPSATEMDAAQWQRQARAEREQMTKELLTMRNDINDRLKTIEQGGGERMNAHGQHLASLLTRLENENRDLQHYATDAKELTHDSWAGVRGHAKMQISQVKFELLSVQGGMERAISSNDKN
jgi:molecular chaperone GrpE (heat shock protein)